MTHIRTYIKFKLNNIKGELHRNYVNPRPVIYLSLIISAIEYAYNKYIESGLFVALAIFYLIYCDYKRGDDVAWERRERIERIRKGSK